MQNLADGLQIRIGILRVLQIWLYALQLHQ
jgi:hypothetical protein